SGSERQSTTCCCSAITTTPRLASTARSRSMRFASGPSRQCSASERSSSSACERSGQATNDVHEFSVLPRAGIVPGGASRRPVLFHGRGHRLLLVADRDGAGDYRDLPPPPARGRSRRSDPRIAGARAAVDRHPLLHHDADVYLGGKSLLRRLSPTSGGDGDHHRREAVDVEGAAL